MGTVVAIETQIRLSELLDRVEQGETITITRHGKVVARLSPESEKAVDEALQAIARVRASLRDRGMTFKLEDVLSARDQGRP